MHALPSTVRQGWQCALLAFALSSLGIVLPFAIESMKVFPNGAKRLHWNATLRESSDAEVFMLGYSFCAIMQKILFFSTADVQLHEKKAGNMWQ